MKGDPQPADLEISIHALRKESDRAAPDAGHVLSISIHALRKESDVLVLLLGDALPISIHALRKESDSFVIHYFSFHIYFNPRSP